jgi:Na+/H+-translocating membrane pyrophosphatase
MQINESRKIFEVQVSSHYTSVCLTINYALILNYINVYDLVHIPLTNSGIYLGLLLGAMLIYAFGSIILLSIQSVTPILCFDAQAQLEENPAIKDQMELMDYLRSNNIFCINTILQLKYFLPFV